MESKRKREGERERERERESIDIEGERESRSDKQDLEQESYCSECGRAELHVFCVGFGG